MTKPTLASKPERVLSSIESLRVDTVSREDTKCRRSPRLKKKRKAHSPRCNSTKKRTKTHGLNSQRQVSSPRQPNFRTVPYAQRALDAKTFIPKHSVLHTFTSREEWQVASGDLVRVCNEAARRRAVKEQPERTRYFKPLSDDYIQDRLFYDDPCFGFALRHKDSQTLQGFILATTWTVWQHTFRWTSVESPFAFISPMDRMNHSHDGGRLAASLNQCRRSGDPRAEGIIWERICEVSLLGALGCGRWLLFKLFERLLEQESHDYVVLQATHSAVPFYERVGFVRIGTVARSRDNSHLPQIAYRHWTTSWHNVRASKTNSDEVSYVMAFDLRSVSLRAVQRCNYQLVYEQSKTYRWRPDLGPHAAKQSFQRYKTRQLHKNQTSTIEAEAETLMHAHILIKHAIEIDPQEAGALFTFCELVRHALCLSKQYGSHKMVRALQEAHKSILTIYADINKKSDEQGQKEDRVDNSSYLTASYLSVFEKFKRRLSNLLPAGIESAIVEYTKKIPFVNDSTATSIEDINSVIELSAQTSENCAATHCKERYHVAQLEDTNANCKVSIDENDSFSCNFCNRSFCSDLLLTFHKRRCKHGQHASQIVNTPISKASRCAAVKRKPPVSTEFKLSQALCETKADSTPLSLHSSAESIDIGSVETNRRYSLRIRRKRISYNVNQLFAKMNGDAKKRTLNNKLSQWGSDCGSSFDCIDYSTSFTPERDNSTIDGNERSFSSPSNRGRADNLDFERPHLPSTPSTATGTDNRVNSSNTTPSEQGRILPHASSTNKLQLHKITPILQKKMLLTMSMSQLRSKARKFGLKIGCCVTRVFIVDQILAAVDQAK